eukprot:4394445-Heterocapsa_arctica.AAC.1
MFFTPHAVEGLERSGCRKWPGLTAKATRTRAEGSTRGGRWRSWSQCCLNLDGKSEDLSHGASTGASMTSGRTRQNSFSS